MKNSQQKGFLNITILIIILLVLAGGVYSYKKNRNLTPKNNEDKVENIIENKNEQTVSGKVLNLSNQNLTKAPDYIFSQKDIVELNLSNNSINGALQSQIQNLQNLKVLNLSNNKFTGVPAEIGQLKKLEVLNLSNNQLTGLPYELGNLSNLKLLDLTGNNYSEADLTIIRKNLSAQTIIKTN